MTMSPARVWRDGRGREGGVVAVLTIVAALATLYAVSYPLAGWMAATETHLVPTGPAELSYLVLAGIGLALAVTGRKDLTAFDWLVAIGLAVPVWLAIQAPFWQFGWTPFIPYYDPTLHATETAFMTLGGIVLARRHGVVRVLVAERRYRATLAAFVLGGAVGLVLATVNVLLFIVGGDAPSASDAPNALLRALKPGILEEVTFRLLFLALVIVILRRYLSPSRSAIVAIVLSAAFHAAIHVPDLIVTNPVAAIGTTAVLSVVFGIPLAVLAYRRGLESAMACHWTIDAIRFGIGF